MLNLKTILIAGLLSLGPSLMAANYTCTSTDAQGNCLGWIELDDGSYHPNQPGAQGNPANPDSRCVCAATDSNGNCTYYSACPN